MALNSEQDWKDSLELVLVPVTDTSWADSLANWADSETTALMEAATITSSSYVFSKTTFKTQLLANVTNSADASTALQPFVDAWGDAADLSQITVAGGVGFGFADIQAVGLPTNTNTIKISLKAELLAGGNADDIQDSAFAPAFRNAFLAEIFLIIGDAINPAPPPPRIPFAQSDGTK